MSSATIKNCRVLTLWSDSSRFKSKCCIYSKIELLLLKEQFCWKTSQSKVSAHTHTVFEEKNPKLYPAWVVLCNFCIRTRCVLSLTYKNKSSENTIVVALFPSEQWKKSLLTENLNDLSLNSQMCSSLTKEIYIPIKTQVILCWAQ